jgi:uncharacterized protein with HEPN domain
MPRRDDAVLAELLEAAGKIERFIANSDRANFDANEMLQGAVLYWLAVVGEACNRLTADFRKRHPEVPWREVTAMRNILIHQYGSVDLNIVWDAATFNAPQLAVQVERILAEEFPSVDR